MSKTPETTTGTEDRDMSCESRIDRHLEGRLDDLRRLWEGDCDSDEADTLADYGLCFDYVAPDTFNEQPEGYFRYQLSWGGPSDEFRFYVNPDFTCHRIEYWFLDWFDGACCTMTGDDTTLLLDIWDWFREIEVTDAAYEKARGY